MWSPSWVSSIGGRSSEGHDGRGGVALGVPDWTGPALRFLFAQPLTLLGAMLPYLVDAPYGEVGIEGIKQICRPRDLPHKDYEIGRASCRERV